MEIITGNVPQAKPADDVGPKVGAPDEFSEGMRKSVEAAEAVIRSSGADRADEKREEAEEVDVDASSKKDPVLSGVNRDQARYDSDERLIERDAVEKARATITEEHKSRFLDSVVSGSRYTETFSLFGGKLLLKVRSRTNEETDAITAYVRKMVADGRIRVDYDYSSFMRKLLAVAQVDEMNGVRNPEMKAPMFYEDSGDTLVHPGWEPVLEAWEKRPESVLAAVVRCILTFEARYWYMIQRAEDKNFWVPGEATGA